MSRLQVETSPCLEPSATEAFQAAQHGCHGVIYLGEGTGNSRKAGELPTPGWQGSRKKVEVPKATSGHFAPRGVYFHPLRFLSHTHCMCFPVV